ncbi:flavin reductase [Xylanimonas allomyrinae]|uniref:Flavin reductase n=1 Tax=Xylanimonas allomyrinae TaxID=2509459 RepID=A0A4P6EWC9_9MICO|nr:flavin reductase family protein [Xylanimonas allomyrinae]QAY64867.1 flavin reductase [Xylanimonas allomyrinae]
MTTENLTTLEVLLAEQDEPQLTAAAFKDVFRRHPAGVAVVALRHGDQPVGFTATSVISVSAQPPLFAFSLASSSSSWPAVSAAQTLAVSFLADHQGDVSARFATSGIDRFAAGGWTALPTGEPVIDGAVSWIRARIVQRTPVGDSYLVSLRALDAGTTQAPPLVYRDRSYHRLSHGTAS